MPTTNSALNTLFQIKFEDHPELVGTSVYIEGLDSLECDVIKGFDSKFPGLDSLWVKDKFWLPGTDLVMFWRTRNFQLSVKFGQKREIESISKKSLVHLGFFSDELEMKTVLTDAMLHRVQEQLQEFENEQFLHLLLGFSDDLSLQWNEEWKKEFNYKEQLQEYEKNFYLMSRDKSEQLDETKKFSLILSKQFFPRKMFIHDACVTNIPSSLIWQYKSRQNPNH